MSGHNKARRVLAAGILSLIAALTTTVAAANGAGKAGAPKVLADNSWCC